MRKNVVKGDGIIAVSFLFHFFSIALTLVPATASYDHKHERLHEN